jgi:urea carboxylase
MMIQLGLAEAAGADLAKDTVEMQQSTYNALLQKGYETGAGHAMEVRVYAENPAEQFRPCPGLLQYVHIPTEHDWLRVETWVCI